MNTKTLLTVKTDKSLKEAAQNIAGELGFSLGTLVNAFLKQFVRTKEVTFSETYRPSEYLIQAIEESRKEDISGKLKGFKDLDEMWKDLES